jgi:hypothetical protein
MTPEAWSAASVGRSLAATAVRFQPTPYFEERLADRLRRAADRSAASAPAATVLPFPGALPDGLGGSVPADSSMPRTGGVMLGPLGPLGPLELRQSNRSLLVGGAIASGVSLAGAAYLAWRHGAIRHGAVRHGGWRPSRRVAG